MVQFRLLILVRRHCHDIGWRLWGGKSGPFSHDGAPRFQAGSPSLPDWRPECLPRPTYVSQFCHVSQIDLMTPQWTSSLQHLILRSVISKQFPKRVRAPSISNKTELMICLDLTDCGDKPVANVVSISYGLNADDREDVTTAIIQRQCTEFGKVRSQSSSGTSTLSEFKPTCYCSSRSLA